MAAASGLLPLALSDRASRLGYAQKPDFGSKISPFYCNAVSMEFVAGIRGEADRLRARWDRRRTLINRVVIWGAPGRGPGGPPNYY